MGLILDWMPRFVTWHCVGPHVSKQQNCVCFYRHCEGKSMEYKRILTADKISTLMVGEVSCKTLHEGIMKGTFCFPGDQWIKRLLAPWAWCRLPAWVHHAQMWHFLWAALLWNEWLHPIVTNGFEAWTKASWSHWEKLCSFKGIWIKAIRNFPFFKKINTSQLVTNTVLEV